jgi:hypothetical protein
MCFLNFLKDFFLLKENLYLRIKIENILLSLNSYLKAFYFILCYTNFKIYFESVTKKSSSSINNALFYNYITNLRL